MSTALSTALTALAESLAPALEGKPAPAPATLYAALIRARDEAHCLEARAGARDQAVKRLLGQVTTICDETARLAATIDKAVARRAKPRAGGTIQ